MMPPFSQGERWNDEKKKKYSGAHSRVATLIQPSFRAFNVSKLSLNFDNFFILVFFFCRSSTNLKKIWDFGKILLSLTELQGGPREKLGSGF